MITSEAEAKTKLCHKSLPEGGASGVSLGRGGKCLGSGCMAWREYFLSYPIEMIHQIPPYEPHGYCGLAGKP
jgi:hypothetical protein